MVEALVVKSNPVGVVEHRHTAEGPGQRAGILELQREARNASAERIWPSRVGERYDLVSVGQQAVGDVATRIAERARNRVHFLHQMDLVYL